MTEEQLDHLLGIDLGGMDVAELLDHHLDITRLYRAQVAAGHHVHANVTGVLAAEIHAHITQRLRDEG